MITIIGAGGIKATILADSISKEGKRMLTWEIEYPRLILAELNTHRQLSRNSFSSRAVPFIKMLDQLQGEPVRFGANQPGMQDKGEDFNAPQMMKTVLSATELDNFFWLRDDDATDPTLRELAKVMRESADASTSDLLAPGEWHLPYIDIMRASNGNICYIIDFPADAGDPVLVTLDQAIKVSCARCAAVSYRNEGYDLAKSLEVYDRLVGSDRKHASAFEHQATPMEKDNAHNLSHYDPRRWEIGVSHMDCDGFFWSGNLKGFIQYRKLIKGECYINPIVV